MNSFVSILSNCRPTLLTPKMTIPIVANIAAGKVCQDADVKGIVTATVN